jgi:hypothetical protein
MRFNGQVQNGANGGRLSKKKQLYIRPTAIVVTAVQAEAGVWAKAAPEGQEFENCSELIAEARKRQEHGRD